jgi:hypothetical protein
VIVFLVPDGTEPEDFSTQVCIVTDTPFTVVLDTLYGVIGCTEVAVKPKLLYKLMRVKVALAMRLRCDDDWDGLKEEVAMAQGAKKLGGNVTVEVILENNVCCRFIIAFATNFSFNSISHRSVTHW